ncbi:MAG TPA: histidine kinase, partial [Fervidobacterium nodosum]|nr:histidine kinase [Fervidobacterium nodosum]
MITRKICESLVKIFEVDKNIPEINEIADEIAQFVGVNKISIAIYEENKSLFRVLFTNLLPAYSKIPYSLVDERDSFSKTSIMDLDNLYLYKLKNTNSGKIIGLVLTDSIPSKMPNFNELSDFLSFVLNFIPGYEKSKK